MRTLLLTLLLMGAAAPAHSDTIHILGGESTGEWAVSADSADVGGYLIFRHMALDPDSLYFFPRKDANWDAYIIGGNATTWASCYGMTGWAFIRSTETPGYIALEYRGRERYGVAFVYFDSLWSWDGTYDLIIKQQ